VTWDQDKLVQHDEVWQQTHPQDVEPYHELAFLYAVCSASMKQRFRGGEAVRGARQRGNYSISVIPIDGSTVWMRRRQC
jgi:hypothetical protein